MPELTNVRDQALKFFIQCSHPLLIERGRGLASFWDLSDTKGGHFMSDELDLYDEAINVAFPGNRGLESAAICKMRADAVKNNPRDEKLGLSCFRGCLARENLEYAQQVSITVPMPIIFAFFSASWSETFPFDAVRTVHRFSCVAGCHQFGEKLSIQSLLSVL